MRRPTGNGRGRTYSERERVLLVVKVDLAEEAADLEVLLERDLGAEGNVAPERVPLVAAQLERGRQGLREETAKRRVSDLTEGAKARRKGGRTPSRLFISMTSFLAESYAFLARS